MTPGSKCLAAALSMQRALYVHDSKPVLQRIDAGQAQGGQFAQTVAGHSHRVNTKGDEVSSHGVFQGEQGRLLPPGLLKVLLSIMEQ